MTRKHFCLYPFTAFSIDTGGHPRICCNNNAWTRNYLNTPISDPNFNLQEDYNNPLHKELRRFIIADNRHPSCQKCWDIEDEGATSFRQWYNTQFNINDITDEEWLSKCSKDGTFTDINFAYLDITFGNKCNLKCVMCNEGNSSLLLKEMYENDRIDFSYYNELVKLDWSSEDDQHLSKLYNYLSEVKQIHITGGEPLLINHRALLQKCIDLGVAKNIAISYNSNLSVLPKMVMDCWKEFKQVYLCVSVDGYKELNDFIRFPSNWDKLQSNLRSVNQLATEYKNISIQLHSTFSMLNCIEITNFLDWAKQISSELECIERVPMFNYVFQPKYFDPAHLPSSLKKIAINRFNKWCDDNQDYVKDDSRLEMLASYFSKMEKLPKSNDMYLKGKEMLHYYETVRKMKYPSSIDNV